MRYIGGKRVWVAVVSLLIAWGAVAERKPASWISVEAETGLVIAESNADIERPPASMIKLMLMLLVAEGIEEHTWTLDTPITASRKAQRMGGTQVYLAAGETHPLDLLMKAVAVSSANDAAMAVAEGLWGNEDAYLARMNERAAELGMAHTEFHSVHGLPPSRGEKPDRTTARDMATLGRACVTMPQILAWTNLRSYEFRLGEGKKYTTNKLLRRRDDMDGLKTGFINAAGFCITATLKKGDIRIISVVMGHDNKMERFALAERLLDDGIKDVRKEKVVEKGDTVLPAIPVLNSELVETRLTVGRDLWVTALQSDWENIQTIYDYPEELSAPANRAQEVGEARVELDGRVLDSTAIYLTEDLPEVTFLGKLERMVTSMFSDD
jgi:serine-type D-Ala-D-Ala carboxypeptidase (penicillin-binding protein 5/6)